MPGAMTIEEQVEAYQTSDIIIQTHGAQMANMVWAKEGVRAPPGLPSLHHKSHAPSSSSCWAVMHGQLSHLGCPPPLNDACQDPMFHLG